MEYHAPGAQNQDAPWTNPNYYTTDAAGHITAFADFRFDESALETTRAIVRGHDARLYFAGEEPAPAQPAPPTPDELEARFSALVAGHLDAFARERQYDNITAARLAALSAEYAADGRAANAVYDATWTAAIALMPRVRADELAPEEAAAALPAPLWPTPSHATLL